MELIDLHLGAAEAKPFSSKWLEANGPKPNGPGIIALDVLIAVLVGTNLALFINVCIWMLT